MTKSFKELIVWQKARDLAIIIYKLTGDFPAAEKYALANQMRRAVISISSNIAESYHRFHSKEKKQLLAVAFGSGAELESQLEVAKMLFSDIDYGAAKGLLTEVLKMLNKLITSY